MLKFSEGTFALGGLAVFAFWLFVCLPILNLPSKVDSQQRQYASESKQESDAEPKGTAQAPFFVEVMPTPKTAGERAQEAEDREEKKSADRWLVRWTAALFLATVGLMFATGVLGYFALRQSRDMRDSIASAARAAVAMEQVAQHIEISAQAAVDSVVSVRERTAMQMRAYLAVIVFQAVYQERNRELRFEGKPLIVNSGQTPAHNVRFRAKSDILPGQLPDDFDFTLDTPWVGGSLIGPHHNAIMNAIVDRYVDDNEVAAIKRGSGMALRVWGQVLYEDIFGEEHFTNFHQLLIWTGPADNELVFGLYPPRNNDAN
jgi:hypothetical protein